MVDDRVSAVLPYRKSMGCRSLADIFTNVEKFSPKCHDISASVIRNFLKKTVVLALSTSLKL